MAEILTLASCVVDLGKRRVSRGPEGVALSAQEAALLGYLAARAGRTVPREELLAEVLGYAQGSSSRALDAAIRRLRNKIEADPKDPVHVLTVHGEGYSFRLPSAEPPALDGIAPYGDAFVGRDEVLGAVREAIGRSAVVTLHGPPGAGKTRMAIEYLLADRAAWAGGTLLVAAPR